MKFLKCKLCRGEMDIIGNERGLTKKVKCTNCGFSNEKEKNFKEPEIIIVKKREFNGQV